MKEANSIANTYKDVWSWLKNPVEERLELGFSAKLGKFVQVFLMDILVSSVVIGTVLGIHFYIQRLETPLEPFDLMELLLLSIVIAPIFEELIFRFMLIYKRNYPLRLINKLTKGKVKRNWGKIFKIQVYVMAVLFGFVHLFNYSNLGTLLLLFSPIIIGGQLIGGFLISYLRVKLGFLWAVASHMLFNGIITIVFVLIFHNGVITQVSQDNLELEVVGLQYVESEDSTLETKIEGDKIFSIQANDYGLQEILNEIGEEDEIVYDNSWVDFEFTSEEGIASDKLIDLLDDEIRFVD